MKVRLICFPYNIICSVFNDESGTITICNLPSKYILTAKHEIIFRYVIQVTTSVKSGGLIV